MVAHPRYIKAPILKTVRFLALSILLVFCQDAQSIDFIAKELVVQTTSGAVRGTSVDDHAWAWLGFPTVVRHSDLIGGKLPKIQHRGMGFVYVIPPPEEAENAEVLRIGCI